MADSADNDAKAAPKGAAAPGAEVAGFDEEAYLRAYPDVAAAILRGEAASGLDHYRIHGAREGRRHPVSDQDPRGELILSVQPLVRPEPGRADVGNSVEGLFVSKGGGVMVVGWADDSADPIEYIRVLGSGWRVTFDPAQFARLRRPDVEKALNGALHPFGVFALTFGDQPLAAGGVCQVEIGFRTRNAVSASIPPRHMEDEELRNVALSYLYNAEHFGNAHVKAIACLEKDIGRHLLAINRSIVSRIVAAPYVERFGYTGKRFKGSIVVCLYGKLEYMFLQNALYSGLAGIEDYEFIYVSNSPELSEGMLQEAKISAAIYDVAITLVILPGNAGFGAANNAAVAAASTGRVLIVNPDVFPKERDWAAKHTDLIASRRKEETRFFGVPLYYDDGSLMHGGMYFELDQGVAFERQKNVVWRLLRVEHYGKGAPAGNDRFLRPRPVPAVTGAFISLDRGWFEKLEGFSVDYVFGHYEDADLALKSIEAGTAPWLHDIRLWHLEGKGSTRLPVHEGGSLVNRWVFSSRWGELISDGLLGPAPTHPLFQGAATAPAAKTPPAEEAPGARAVLVR